MTDPATYHALYLTFAVMIITWLVQTPISLLLGTFIAGQQRYRAFLAVLFFLPLLMSSAAIAIAFKSLLDPNFGLGAGLHLPFLAQDWLGDPTLAFITVIFVIAWQFIPLHTLLYQGGVRQIPEQMYEAAQIDGAGRVRQFFSITIPQPKYTILTSSTLMLVGSLVYFDLIWNAWYRLHNEAGSAFWILTQGVLPMPPASSPWTCTSEVSRRTKWAPRA
jgi:raffinose/stachyose/melibiose transport system permease protein